MKAVMSLNPSLNPPLPMRAMSAALLFEGLLVLAACWLAQQHLLHGDRPQAQPHEQIISLVAPEPAPTPPAPTPKVEATPPVPVKTVPHPVPRPTQPLHPAPLLPQLPQPVPLDHSAATVPSVVTPPAAPSQPPTPPAHAGPSATDLFAAKLRAAIQASVVYPFALRDMAVTGQVEVEFVYLDGAVSDVQVVQGGKVSAFDRAAIAAVQAAPMPMPPAELAGHAHTFKVTVNFSFS